jgi:RNA polymerase sigma factor (sigma-70 family)
MIDNPVQQDLFWTIYHKYSPFLNAHARKKMYRFLHLAEDVLQETWIAMLPHLDRLSAMTEECAAAYLFATFDRIAVKLIKEDPSAQGTVVSFEEFDEEVVADRTDLLDEICASETSRQIAEIILSMPKKDRDVLRLHLIESMTFHEIAKCMHLPYKTVHKRFQRANNRLVTKFLEEEGHVNENK